MYLQLCPWGDSVSDKCIPLYMDNSTWKTEKYEFLNFDWLRELEVECSLWYLNFIYFTKKLRIATVGGTLGVPAIFRVSNEKWTANVLNKIEMLWSTFKRNGSTSKQSIWITWHYVSFRMNFKHKDLIYEEAILLRTLHSQTSKTHTF